MLFCLLGLVFLLIKTLGFGSRTYFSRPDGSEKKGIWYAFTSGMMPWVKESAKKHLPTYITGVLFHVGIFTAMLFLVIKILAIGYPDWILTPIRILFIVSISAGIGLLIKRMVKPEMTVISCVDDYISNLTVTAFILGALAATFTDSLLFLFYLIAIGMFLYIPLGKIRHCFFFFYTRILFGRFFGRRGIFPRKSVKT